MKTIFLFVLLFILNAPFTFAVISTEDLEQKDAMVLYWLNFKYSNCDDKATTISREAAFEYLRPLQEAHKNSACKQAENIECFELIDKIVGKTYTDKIAEKKYKCEESEAYLNYIGSKKVKAIVHTASVACNTKSKVVMQSGSKWCTQKVACNSAFQINGKVFEKGDYNFFIEPDKQKTCPASFYSVETVHQVQPLKAWGLYEGDIIPTSGSAKGTK